MYIAMKYIISHKEIYNFFIILFLTKVIGGSVNTQRPEIVIPDPPARVFI